MHRYGLMRPDTAVDTAGQRGSEPVTCALELLEHLVVLELEGGGLSSLQRLQAFWHAASLRGVYPWGLPGSTVSWYLEATAGSSYHIIGLVTTLRPRGHSQAEYC